MERCKKMGYLRVYFCALLHHLLPLPIDSGHADGYPSQKDHVTHSQNIIQSQTHGATLHIDHHLMDRLVTANGQTIHSGTLV